MVLVEVTVIPAAHPMINVSVRVLYCRLIVFMFLDFLSNPSGLHIFGGESISHKTCWHQWKHRFKNEIYYGLSHTQMSLCNVNVLHDKVGRRDHERMYKQDFPACNVQRRGKGTNKRKATLRVDVCIHGGFS